MSTINRELAEELVRGDGKSKHGTAGYCLVRYQNRTKYDIPGVDLYDPNAKVNCFDYAIFSSRRKYEEFTNSDTVGGVDILWGSKRFKKDEEERIRTEEGAELTEGIADLISEFGDEEIPGLSERER